MGPNPSRWLEKQQHEQKRNAVVAVERAFCSPIIRAWNAHGWPPRFYPTIGAAWVT
jgi:hypothetical protein